MLHIFTFFFSFFLFYKKKEQKRERKFLFDCRSFLVQLSVKFQKKKFGPTRSTIKQERKKKKKKWKMWIFISTSLKQFFLSLFWFFFRTSRLRIWIRWRNRWTSILSNRSWSTNTYTNFNSTCNCSKCNYTCFERSKCWRSIKDERYNLLWRKKRKKKKEIALALFFDFFFFSSSFPFFPFSIYFVISFFSFLSVLSSYLSFLPLNSFSFRLQQVRLLWSSKRFERKQL